MEDTFLIWSFSSLAAIILICVLWIKKTHRKEIEEKLTEIDIDEVAAEKMVMHFADIMIKYSNENPKRISLLNCTKDQMWSAISIYDKKLLSQIEELKEKRKYLNGLSGFMNDFIDDETAKAVNHVRILKKGNLPIDEASLKIYSQYMNDKSKR